MYKCAAEVSVTMAAERLGAIGFGHGEFSAPADSGGPWQNYSGGWKMKMQLCAAELVDADILMLDEPTGHMDTDNKQWMLDWLRRFMNTQNKSIVVTSTNKIFLNKICTDVIWIEHCKLRKFGRAEKGAGASAVAALGAVDAWLAQHPECRSYFELKTEKYHFSFPKPVQLEGVKTRTRQLLKLQDVTFGYSPDKLVPTVKGISLALSQASKVLSYQKSFGAV